jgi:ribosomal protein L11 methyltransferase
MSAEPQPETPRWIEVSIVVDGELAEAVADVLGRFVSNGVVVESGVKYNDEEDEGTPFGPVRVFGYLPFEENIDQKRRQLEEAFWHLNMIQALPPVTFKPIVEEDWMAAWKQHYQPIPIGKRLLVLPAWLENPFPDRIPIKIDPSMAFGTGTHPSTQLCLDLIETYLTPGQPVVDVGCGSGILSIAALKLGASTALAVDIDAQAVRSTRENAERNDITDELVTEIGSVEVAARSAKAPLVLANILAPVIIRLLDAGLGDLASAGGVLVLAGILDHQANDVVAAAAAHGLVELERRQILDWVGIALRKL